MNIATLSSLEIVEFRFVLFLGHLLENVRSNEVRVFLAVPVNEDLGIKRSARRASRRCQTRFAFLDPGHIIMSAASYCL
jgi:hypothetical protein